MMQRRSVVQALSALGLATSLDAALAPTVAAQALRGLAVLDFELVDDHNNPATKAAQERRLVNATLQLRDELTRRQLYRLIDLAPAQELLTKLRNQQEDMYRCDDCAVQVGQVLGAELVMGTWVQKVSELTKRRLALCDAGPKIAGRSHRRAMLPIIRRNATRRRVGEPPNARGARTGDRTNPPAPRPRHPSPPIDTWVFHAEL